MKTFPASQTPLYDRAHVEPLYFAHLLLDEETLYLSDRCFRFNGHDYEDYLVDIPGTIHSIEQSGGYLNVDARLEFRNDGFRSASSKFIDFLLSKTFTRRPIDLYVQYLERGQIPSSDVFTLLHRFVMGELREVREESFSLELASLLYAIDSRELFTQINRTNWPNAAPSAIGKYENLWYGELKGVPCHCVDAGAVSSLFAEITKTQTSIELSNADWPIAFPSSGTIQIEYEKISYTGKSGNTLTGCSRGASGTWAAVHPKGAPVWQVKATYKYLISRKPVYSIDKVYVAGTRMSSGDYTLNANDSGRHTISFSQVTLLRNQGSHSHGFYSKMEHKGTSGSFTASSGMAASGIEQNLRDGYMETFCHVGRTGVNDVIRTATFTVNFPTWAGPEPKAVYACIRHDNAVYNATFRITAPETIDLDHSGSTVTDRKKLTSLTPPTTLTVTGNMPVGDPITLIANIYEMWLEIEYENTGNAGENAVWERLAPLVTVDGTGIKDNGSGDYTGTPNAAITNPADVRKHILVELLGRPLNEIGSSFSSMRTTYANRISGGYKIATILHQLGQSPAEVVRKLDQETRSQLREEGGKWVLEFHGDSEPSSVLIIDKTMIIGSPVFGQTRVEDIANVVKARHTYNWSGQWESVYGQFLGQVERTNSASVTKYGALPRELDFYAIAIQAMAEDVADWLLREGKDTRPTVEMTCNAMARALERNDYFVLNDVPVSAWNGKKWRVLSIREDPHLQQFSIKALMYVS